MKNIFYVWILWLVIFGSIPHTALSAESSLSKKYLVGDVVFTNKEDAARFKSLLDYYTTHFKNRGLHNAFTTRGNFYSTNWCASDCNVTQQRDKPNSYYVELSTFFYKLPDVFGVNLESVKTPDGNGWGTDVFVAQNTRNILGPDLLIQLYQNKNNEREKDSLFVLNRNSYIVFPDEGARSQVTLTEMDIRMTADEEIETDLASAANMKALALKRINILRHKVDVAIQNDQIMKCDYVPSDRSNLPPLCNPRKLTRLEKQEALKKSKDYFNQQTSVLNLEYKNMYQALLDNIGKSWVKKSSL